MSIGTYCRSVRKRSRNPATATNLRYPVSAICRHQSAEAKRISMYEPRQYLPISAGVDFRIPLRLVFKIRIKGEELPKNSCASIWAQAVEEQAFGIASGQAIESPDAHCIAGRNFRRRSLCKDHRCQQERGEEVCQADARALKSEPLCRPST